jgi:peptide/nickel transport system substrate-binding protein
MSTEPTLEQLLRAALTRRQLLHRLGLGGLAVSAPAILGACGGSRPTAAPPKVATGSVAPVDHFYWLGVGGGLTLDTAKNGGEGGLALEPIVIYDERLQPKGHLVSSWHAADPVTYVYKVRPGVRFHDGTPLTAEDIAFAMQRHDDPKTESAYAGLIPPLKRIAVTAPDEVTVTLEKPNATWQYLPAVMQVAPKRFFEEMGKDFGAPGKPVIGTGPYKLTAFHASDRSEYVANNRYWGPKPFAKKLTAKSGANDVQTVMLAMRAGDADGTFGVSASILRNWKQIPGITVTTEPAPHLAFASFDVSAKPWDDVHVRRAFAHALDRRGLLGVLLKDAGHVEDSIVPRSAWGDKVNAAKLDQIYASVPVYDFSLDKAKAELAQSAYPDGLSATLWYYSGDTSEKIGLNWQHNLKQIGVNLKLQVASDELGAAREDNHHELGFHLNDSWAAEDFPDPVDVAFNLLPSAHAKRGYFNEANYRNPTVDRLIEENLTSLDVNQRADAIAQVMKIVAEDVPYLPIWTRSDSVAISNKFVYEGYTPWWNYQMWINHIKRAA